MKRVRLKGRYYLAILAAIATAFVAVYAYKFAPGSGWRLSQDTEDWARFGEYIGGVFGILAFVGVLITLQLQREQIRKQDAQGTIDELHRLCRELSSSIDRQLDYPISLVTTTVPGDQVVQNRETIRCYLDEIEGAEGYGPVRVPKCNSLMADRIRSVVGELNQLSDCIADSVGMGGPKPIQAFYRGRYRHVGRRLQVAGYMLASSYLLRDDPEPKY